MQVYTVTVKANKAMTPLLVTTDQLKATKLTMSLQQDLTLDYYGVKKRAALSAKYGIGFASVHNWVYLTSVTLDEIPKTGTYFYPELTS